MALLPAFAVEVEVIDLRKCLDCPQARAITIARDGTIAQAGQLALDGELAGAIQPAGQVEAFGERLVGVDHDQKAAPGPRQAGRPRRGAGLREIEWVKAR